MSIITLQNVKKEELAAKIADLDPSDSYRVNIQSMKSRQKAIEDIEALFKSTDKDIDLAYKSDDEIMDIAINIQKEVREQNKE